MGLQLAVVLKVEIVVAICGTDWLTTLPAIGLVIHILILKWSILFLPRSVAISIARGLAKDLGILRRIKVRIIVVPGRILVLMSSRGNYQQAAEQHISQQCPWFLLLHL